jgi:hypothetical protein
MLLDVPDTGVMAGLTPIVIGNGDVLVPQGQMRGRPLGRKTPGHDATSL